MKPMMRTIWMCMVFLLLVAGGCAKKPDVKQEERLFDGVPESIPSVPSRPYPGSLWEERNSESLLFMDHKASQVNDIVTVQIVESASGSGTSNSKYEKETETSLGISALFGLPQSLGMNNFLGSGEPFQPVVGANSINDYEGKGTTKRTGSLTATITCRVMRLFPNGNMEIRGTREVSINREKQYLVLSGVIRQEDISSFNTIQSDYIADARIEYYGEGYLADKESPGWLYRVMDWIWPF